MSTFTCPDGHVSATASECSVCGATMDNAQAPAADSAASSTQAVLAPTAVTASAANHSGHSADACKSCGAPRENESDEVCPNCGVDYASGVVELPQAVLPPAAVPSRTVNPVAPPAAVPATVPTPATASNSAALLAVVKVDLSAREGRPDDEPVPGDLGEHIFELSGDFISFGRSSKANIVLPEDSGISRLQGEFVRFPDGSYGVRDGIRDAGGHKPSSNGTALNGKPTQGAEVVRIKAGDVVSIGFFYTIEIRAMAAASA
jgi:pSer/pThr/pTyr-binding forkhead associated (FHA) protein